MSFQTSASTEKLDAALAQAQSVMDDASKSAMNPHFRKSYSDLADVWAACREALTKVGISVTQWPLSSPEGSNKLELVTRLACAGEWMMATFSIPVMKSDAQAYGAAITYARRFALAAAVGVVSSDDDQAASTQSIKAEMGEVQKKNVESVKAQSVPKAPQKVVHNFAPGGDSGPPIDSQDPGPAAELFPESNTVERYKVSFGKHHGKTLNEIGLVEAGKYLEWLIESAKKSDKPMGEAALKFQSMYHQFAERFQK